MAKILDQEEQRKALKNIISSIKDIETTNEFLKAQNPTGKYSIIFTGEDGKKYTAEFYAEKKDDIALLIMTHKEKEKNRIANLAQQHRISLDPDDYEILDFSI